MSYSHRYDLIKGGSDNKDEPQQIYVPVATPWWKIALYNLLAAGVGAGVMFLILHSSITREPSTSAPASNTAVSSAAASVTSSPVVPTTTTSSAHVVVATPIVENVDEATKDPDGIAGQILDCGGNPSEARAKGCVYDVMMQDWVPEPCYDGVLTERYLAQGNWTWYRDGEGKSILSDEEMRRGEHGAAWMSASYHKAHCVFSWLKIIRALRNGKGISQELLSYDHVLHCSHGALKEKSDNEDISVAAPTNYARCALYETWKLDFIPDEHDSTE